MVLRAPRLPLYLSGECCPGAGASSCARRRRGAGIIRFECGEAGGGFRQLHFVEHREPGSTQSACRQPATAYVPAAECSVVNGVYAAGRAAFLEDGQGHVVCPACASACLAPSTKVSVRSMPSRVRTRVPAGVVWHSAGCRGVGKPAAHSGQQETSRPSACHARKRGSVMGCALPS